MEDKFERIERKIEKVCKELGEKIDMLHSLIYSLVSGELKIKDLR